MVNWLVRNCLSAKKLLWIKVAEQRLMLMQSGRIVKVWPVSTSLRGLGYLEGSLRTPVGFFQIYEKIGAGMPLGAIFKNRVATGKVWNSKEPSEIDQEKDLILTRILRLDGRDCANRNTLYRYIYIHGTNQESRIGMPTSHGCIRMRNSDIVELFDLVPVMTGVLIEP